MISTFYKSADYRLFVGNIVLGWQHDHYSGRPFLVMVRSFTTESLRSLPPSRATMQATGSPH